MCIRDSHTETCTPPECPEVWADLGITGNVKAAMGLSTGVDSDAARSESSGYQERTCVR